MALSVCAGQRGSLLTLRCPNGTPWSLVASCEDMAAAPQLCVGVGIPFLCEGQLGDIRGSRTCLKVGPTGPRPRRAQVSGHEGGFVQVWNLSEEACVHSFGSYHQGLVQVVAADFGKALAASGSDDGVFCIWDLANMVIQHMVEAQSLMSVWAMGQTFASTKRAMSGSFDGQLHVWDVKSGETSGWRGAPVCALAVDFESGHAVSGSYDGQVYVWDLASQSGSTCSDPHSAAVRCIVANFQ